MLQGHTDRQLLALSRACSALLPHCLLDSFTHEVASTCAQIAYHLVSIFGAVLAKLEQTAKTLATAPNPEKGIKTYVQVLIKLLASTSQSKALHSPLSEGMTFLVLQSIGKILFASTFGHPHQLDPEEALRLVGTLAQEHLATDAQLLAPHLLDLLRQCVIVLSPDSPHRLDARLRHKMQDTLLACVFGSEDTADIFSTPPRTWTPLQTGLADNPDLRTTDGLVHGLWSILGWDVLASQTRLMSHQR